MHKLGIRWYQISFPKSLQWMVFMVFTCFLFFVTWDFFAYREYYFSLSSLECFFSRLLCNVRELPWYINHTRKFKNNVKHVKNIAIFLTMIFIGFYFFIIYSCFWTIHDIFINLSPTLQFTTLYTMKVYPITKSNNRKIH